MDRNEQKTSGRLSTELAGLTLSNPVIPASGTFGFGKDFADLYDLNILGSISFKGTTVEERYGNELPRIADCPSGMLNAVGLQNPGLDHVLAHELPELAGTFHKPLVANISGFEIDEYKILAAAFGHEESIGIIEVNISCPNVHNGGMAFGTDPGMAAKVTEAVKSETDKPVFMKLSPNVTDITEIAKACEDAGADGLSLINTVLGMRIDITSGKPLLGNVTGGLSGPAVFPIAVRMVWQVARSVGIPLIGMGGIASAEDVIEMMMAGASAVEVGAANLKDPLACKRIIEDLPVAMDRLGIDRLTDIIGSAV